MWILSCPWVGIYTIGSPGSHLPAQTATTPAAFLGVQLAPGRLWDLSASIYIYIFLSCWRTLTDTTSLQQVICNEMNPVWTNGQSNSNSKYVHCIIYIKSNSTSITTLTLFQLTKAPLPEISFWITCSFLHVNTDYSRISLEHICNSQWWQKRCPLPVQ